jgi:NarL family two-component system response regulator LiaR
MYKFGIIDNDQRSLEGVRSALKAFSDIHCLIAADSISAFWDEIPERAQLDIIFIDTHFPNASGIEQIPALRRRFPEAIIIMYTDSSEKTDLMAALARGADGYLLKQGAIASLRSHIDTLINGGAVLSPQMARYLVSHLNPPRKIASEQNILLSNKEIETLHLLSLGQSAEAIAKEMSISVNGVKFHLKNIYTKLGVKNRVAALRRFSEYMPDAPIRHLNHNNPAMRGSAV